MPNHNPTTAIALSDTPGTTALSHDATQTSQGMEARARVEAQYVMAIKRPRNEDVVRQSLLRECARPGFARASTPEDPGGALYKLPFGNKSVTGFSVRFAEAAVRAFGNLTIENRILYDDEIRRVVAVTITDLEMNLSIEQVGEFAKVVTRRTPPSDRQVLSTRKNSRGETTYVVAADERDVRQMTNSEISKCFRTGVLRFVPGWLLDECRRRIEETMHAEVKEDPDSWRRRLVDAFAGLRVPAEELGRYLGHDLGEASTEEIAELRAVFAAVRDGETTWRDLMTEKTGKSSDRGSDPNAAMKGKLAEKLASSKTRRGRNKAQDEPEMREPGEEG